MYRNGEYVSFEDYKRDRREPTDNEQKMLLEEVGGLCPVKGCGVSLVNEKNGKHYKEYDIAHIFPQSPTEMEKIILADVEVDGECSESLDNKILLCHNCHTTYDKGKTEAIYQQMLELKRRLASELKAKKAISKETIEEDITKAIDALVSIDENELEKAGKLEYKALEVAKKVTRDNILRMEIEDRVTRYFNYIRQVFKNLDPSGYKFELICTNVKKIYLMLKCQRLSQHEIYEKLSDWFLTKTQSNQSVCEIMTAFFVQNCDVYEISQ
jgi:hypothetical protein